MKKFNILTVAILLLTIHSCTTIPPGYVGIVVNQFGSNKGVQDVTVATGLAWYNPIKYDIYEYPTNVQTAKWTASLEEGKPQNEEITFTNKDNLVISADISISYTIKADKVPSFYVKFRNDNIEDFTHGYLRNITRDAFNETGGSYSIDQIMGDNTDFILKVREKVQKQVSEIGINIEQFGIIGAPRPPKLVTDAINAKLESTQIALRKENEIRQAEADAKKVQIAADAESYANKVKQVSLTPLLVQQ